MNGREDKKDNDLFFVCSLIEYIARKTLNHRDIVVTAIGKEGISHIYDLADVYHCENIDKITEEFIQNYNIPFGSFDNVAACQYHVPTHWDIGKVYKRLILDICTRQGKDLLDTLMEVYQSSISRDIENLNSSAYFENPGYLYESFVSGEMVL
jgi:hypothetical protein